MTGDVISFVSPKGGVISQPTRLNDLSAEWIDLLRPILARFPLDSQDGQQALTEIYKQRVSNVYSGVFLEQAGAIFWWLLNLYGYAPVDRRVDLLLAGRLSGLLDRQAEAAIEAVLTLTTQPPRGAA